MNETPNAMLERAIEVAVVCHAGQVDKNGEAYILHPLRVMLAVREGGGSLEQQAAAVLHDVIEDCGVKDEFLLARLQHKYDDALERRTGTGLGLTGPDASSCTVKLVSVFATRETYQLEVNGRSLIRKFFEPHFVRLSGKKVSWSVCPTVRGA
jgi:hypothetical protein